MAEIDYPQRWLREAQAVTSPEGWRKEKTNELLKCQRGVDELYPEIPELKSVVLNGVPTLFTADVTGNGKFTYTYGYLDADYVPIDVKSFATTSGTGTVTSTVNTTSKSVEVNVTNAKKDDVIKVKVDIDSVSSPESNVTVALTPATIKTVTIGALAATSNLDNTGKGTVTFPYSFTDATYVPTSVTCEPSTAGAAVMVPTVNTTAKTVSVAVTGAANNEKLGFIMNVDSVKSAKKETTAVVPPSIKTVTIGTVPATVNLNDSGSGNVTFSYSFTDANYTPTSVTCVPVVTGSGTANATVNTTAKTVSVDITGVTRATSSTIDFVVDIDGVKSAKKSTSAVSPAYKILTATIGTVPATVNVDAEGVGTIEIPYTYTESQYVANVVKCNTTSTTAVLTPTIDKAAKKATVAITGATVNDEELGFEIEIDGVKSAIKKSKVVTP